jgi:hypothetical protein
MPEGDYEGLMQVIADLHQCSLVWKFAFGRLDSSLGGLEGIEATEVLVIKPWHQQYKPHFTVQLWFVTSRYELRLKQ